MESVYEECLCYELSQLGLRFQRQVELPVRYKGIKLKCGFRMDLVVQDSVVLELKTVDELLPVHSAQLLTYLKLSGKKLGLLINFNEPILKRGLKRLTTMSREPKTSSVTPVSSVFSGLDSLNPLCLCASVVNNLRCSQDTRNKAPSVTSVSSVFSGLDFDFSVLSVSVPLW
jgi:GxxExxY protein